MWSNLAQLRHCVATIGLTFLLFPLPGHAGDVLQLRPNQVPVGSRRAYHLNASEFEIGDLVLSKGGLTAEVVGFDGNKLLLDGRLISSGEYDPSEFVKEVTSLDGIKAGWSIPDGVGDFGTITRMWEDGRIEVHGRRFDFATYNIDDFDPAGILPPAKPRSGFFKVCAELLKGFEYLAHP
jgi:hypothetical protein